jgi:hypothetical protein
LGSELNISKQLLCHHMPDIEAAGAREIHLDMLKGGSARVRDFLKKSPNKKIQNRAEPLANTLH